METVLLDCYMLPCSSYFVLCQPAGQSLHKWSRQADSSGRTAICKSEQTTGLRTWGGKVMVRRLPRICTCALMQRGATPRQAEPSGLQTNEPLRTKGVKSLLALSRQLRPATFHALRFSCDSRVRGCPSFSNTGSANRACMIHCRCLLRNLISNGVLNDDS